MAEIRFKLAPPWITCVNVIKAMFEKDAEINIIYNNDDVTLKLFIDNDEKAAAIARLLPKTQEYGNISLKIEVIPTNSVIDLGIMSNKKLFDTAFNNNPVYAYSTEIVGVFQNVLTYIVFKNEVVQFFNDNLNDIHGIVSTLYEFLADELFDEAGLQGVYYNTDTKIGLPLCEWP